MNIAFAAAAVADDNMAAPPPPPLPLPRRFRRRPFVVAAVATAIMIIVIIIIIIWYALQVRRAKAKYLSQVNAVASKERDITAAQRDLDSVCGEEDNEQDENLQSIRMGHTQLLRQLEEGGKRQDELLASLQPAGLASPTEQAWPTAWPALCGLWLAAGGL